MAKFLRFNSEDYCILNRPKVTNNIAEVKISDIVIDFEGKTLADLPFKYQEVQIIDITDSIETVELIAYVNKYDLPTYETGNEPNHIRIKLFPSQVFATKRTITKTVKDKTIKDFVEEVVEPLIDDGFTIASNDLNGETITETYIGETIEKTLNTLAKGYNFIWYTDELKNIYFKDVTNILVNPATLTLTKNTDYLKSIKPLIRSVDYANVLNIKNIRLITDKDNIQGKANLTIKGDETINFTNDLWFSDTAFSKQYPNELGLSPVFRLRVDGVNYEIDYDKSTGFSFPSEIGFDGEDNDVVGKDFLLIRDSDENTIITGIKFQTGDATNNIEFINSSLVLEPFSFRYYDPNEINFSKPLTNTSGIIENTFSANDRRLGLDETTSLAKGLLQEANNETNEVHINFENEETAAFTSFINSLTLGDKITINMPNQFTVGDFIIVSTEKKSNQNLVNYKIVAKNKNLNESFLDIYRKESRQERGEQVDSNLIYILINEGSIVEKAEVLVNGVVING